jgi:predicted amidophosphoribosyltransferase
LAGYSCRRCSANLKPDDKICPACGADLSQVGRKIEVVLEEYVRARADVTAQVTQEERNFLDRFVDWLRKNWTLSAIEIGFPSGVTFVFKRREK